MFLLRLLEDAYVMKDPFTRDRGLMIVGGHCSLCHIQVCCSQVYINTFYMINKG